MAPGASPETVEMSLGFFFPPQSIFAVVCRAASVSAWSAV